MLQGLSHGNAAASGANRSGWFIGHFIDGDALRHSRDVEVKWAHHPREQTNGGFATNRTATTLSILVRGRFRLVFGEGANQEEVLLDKEGDYALWQPGVPHNWVAEEDSLIVTVRWPSLAKDQG